MLQLQLGYVTIGNAVAINCREKKCIKMRSDFCSDSDFRLRGVSPQTCGCGHSEGPKQILTLSIVKLFPIAQHYENATF